MAVERDGAGQLLDEVRAFRARSHQTHIADEDVDKLRQFVDAGGANEAANPGDARIIPLRPRGGPPASASAAMLRNLNRVNGCRTVRHAAGGG